MSQHYIDGRWEVDKKLMISAFDLAVTRGLAVFDTLRTFGGKPFELSRHLQRFRHGANALNIALKYSDQQISKIIDEGLKRNNLSEAVVRCNLTAGINEGLLSSSKPTFIVMFLPLSLPPESKYAEGQKLASFYVERTMPQIKTINYVAAKLGLMAAAKQGADEALYLDRDGFVLETTISNVFFWNGDRLLTPPDEHILSGITRDLIIEIAQAAGIPTIKQRISLKKATTYDESFACSSIKGIMPVVKIDNTVIGDGQPGKKTLQLAKKYHRYTDEFAKSL